MKKVARILGVLLLVVGVCAIGIVGLVEWLYDRSERDVVAKVTQLSAGNSSDFCLFS